jgi:hypothetical protein
LIASVWVRLRRHFPPAWTKALLTTLDLREDDRNLTISFRRCFEAYLGIRLRGEESRHRLGVILSKCSGQWNETSLEATIPVEYAASSWSIVLPRLGKALAEIAWRPLTPNLLTAALRISSQERSRWTKDGRLPSAGSVQIRRAHVVSVPTYSVSVVEELIAHPEIVMGWRDQDAAQKGTDQEDGLTVRVGFRSAPRRGHDCGGGE